MASTVVIVIKRHEREIEEHEVEVSSNTTIGTLTSLFKDEYPAGLKFLNEAGARVPNEKIVQGGARLSAVAADRFPSLREAAELAAAAYKDMVDAGKKRKWKGDKACRRWMIFVAPPSGLSDDGRFHSAPKPYEYWVLWREDFEKLEADVSNLLFNVKPVRNEYLLAGPAGIGKSHAVLALLNRLMRRADNGAAAVKERARLIPILDCRELCRDFRTTLVKAIATGFGDAPLLVDKLLQLETNEEYKGFVSNHSKWALFVLDQYQNVETNPAIQARLNLVLSGQRALFVTSAGGDEVKALNTTSHQYTHRVELAPALSPADYAAWSLIFGTEAILKEPRHRDRLSILGNNPLLLRAWYETCREAGVPVGGFGIRTEEEMEAITQAALKGKGHAGLDQALAARLEQAESTRQLQAESSAAEEGAESPRKRQRAEAGGLGASADTEAAGQSSAAAGIDRPPEGLGTDEGTKAHTDAELSEEQSTSPKPSGMPAFETVYEEFLKHPAVQMITTDLELGYKAACEAGKGDKWIDAHRRLLLSSGFVKVDLDLINGRNYFLAVGELAAKAGNDLVRIVSAQYLEDLKSNGAAFDDREILSALAYELTSGNNPSMAGAYCERAVLAKFCRGFGKKLLPFTLSGAFPKVVTFATGQEQTIASSLISEGVEAVRRGASEWTVVLKPSSFQYRYIDVVQIVVRPAGEASVPKPSTGAVERRANKEAYMKELKDTLQGWVADRKLTLPPFQKGTKEDLTTALLADDEAKAAQQPTEALATPLNSSVASVGGQQTTADGDRGAGEEAGASKQTSRLDPKFEVYVYFGQVSLTKFEKHVFSTEGALHSRYCRLWHPQGVPDEAIHFGICYILPEPRLPQPEKRDCIVGAKEVPLRGRDVQTLIQHRQVCVSFEWFDGELAMVDKWPDHWVRMFQ